MLCYSESNYSKPDVFEQNIFGGNYLVNCTPILDKKGKVSNVIVISTDITELKRIEQNLHESENRYVSLLNTAPVGIAVHQDDRIVFVNPAGCKIMGATTADDIVGKSISAFIHPENQDLYLSRKEKMLKGDTEIYPAEDKYLRIDGHAIDVEVYATSIIYKGKPAVQIIVMDITDRKSFETTLVEKNKEYESLNEEYTSLNEELEEHNKKLLKLNEDLKQAKDLAEESEQLKTIFLTNMSHEVRTPLNAIIGFASLLDEDDLPAEDRKEFISIIHNSGDRLIRLIDDILDLSKIESKNLVVSCEMYNLHELISSSLQTFGKSELLNKKPALELRYNLNPRLSKQQIYTDRIRFKQVLDNLINNAIKYTEKGYVEVGYELLKADHSHMIEISVKDTGKGIPQEKADLIFERFRQVEEFSYHEGTGLGLSIVKGITNLLGGDIRFTSIPGEGSTFYFTLPVDHEIENHSMQHENLVEKPDLSGKHIIIAEDDPNSALFLQTLLDSSDVRIDTAENGLKLMEMIEESSPDLVLLDINMPIISGYECLLEIKAKKPEIPIICQTAYAMPGERDKCVAAGCSGYLTKPILKEVLFRTIDEVLKP